MDDAEFQKLLDAPPPLAIKAGMMTWIADLFLMGFFAALGILISVKMAHNDHAGLWPALGIIGLPTFLVSTIWPWRDLGTRLVLDRGGFTLKRILKRDERWEWNEVSEFTKMDYTAGYGFACVIYFNDASGERRKFFHPDIYGKLRSSSLAQLMNHWRERAIQGK